MPAGDGTGPLGMGPRTGRGAGFCAGYNMAGYANPIPGQRASWGVGRGFFGRGRGHRHWFYATGLPLWARHPFYGAPAMVIAPEQELNYLKDQAEYLATSMEEIQKRIQELEAKAKK
ncbi:DUF5320 domain-containing protein [candidate division KSB1 bacterium]|nr:DUF5320 domain-containing protein [candidate division KSB1 bacterium]